jgi:hypothetical protein
MAYGNDDFRGNNSSFERKMYQGNWACSKCNAEIKELPFEPDPARLSQLLCRECHRERTKDFRGGSRGGSGGGGFSRGYNNR